MNLEDRLSLRHTPAITGNFLKHPPKHSVRVSFYSLFVGILLLIGLCISSIAIQAQLSPITYFSLGLTTFCRQQVCKIFLSPDIAIHSNSKNDLLQVMDTIHALSWQWDIYLGPIKVWSYFNHDGYDGYGVIVMGPYLGVEFTAPNTRNYLERREFFAVHNCNQQDQNLFAVYTPC